MGFLNWLRFGTPLTAAALPTNLASPYAEPNTLSPAVIFSQEFGVAAEAVVTPEVALRVSEVNRALQAHTALVAPLKFEVYRDGERSEEQPFWTTNSASGISPYVRNVGLIRDLFFYGAAVCGAELDAFGLVRDLIHVPREYWDINKTTGMVEVSPEIPANYRQRVIYIPLGTNGLLTDGVDSIRQARKLENARQVRLDAPPPGITIKITKDEHSRMTPEERKAVAVGYARNRREIGVSVISDDVTVEDSKAGELDLFEQGMNSLRLQLAMHTGLPASFLEAGKEGGSSGEMSYTNENGKASELWVFGSARYAYAITARLSMDDVVGPNAEVRADLSDFMVPTPDQLSAESPVTAPEPEAPEVTTPEIPE